MSEQRSEETPSSETQTDGPEVVPLCGCGSTAPPVEGRCPGVPGKGCGRTRVGSKIAAVHDGRSKLTRDDLNARDALVARLLAERGGRESLDIVSQLRVEDYATAQVQLGKVTRRLEALGAVTAAGNVRSSVVKTYDAFSARAERLAAELPKPVPASAAVRASATATTNDLEDLTDDALIERIEALLGRAHELRDQRLHRERVAKEEKEHAAGVTPSPAEGEPAAASDAEPTPPAEPPPPAIDPATRRIIDWHTPEERERRRAEATAVAKKMMWKTSPFL